MGCRWKRKGMFFSSAQVFPSKGNPWKDRRIFFYYYYFPPPIRCNFERVSICLICVTNKKKTVEGNGRTCHELCDSRSDLVTLAYFGKYFNIFLVALCINQFATF